MDAWNKYDIQKRNKNMFLKSLHVLQKKKKKKGIIYQQQYLDAFCGKLNYSFLWVSTLTKF